MEPWILLYPRWLELAKASRLIWTSVRICSIHFSCQNAVLVFAAEVMRVDVGLQKFTNVTLICVHSSTSAFIVVVGWISGINT